MIANSRENAKLKLRIGRQWSAHLGTPLLTHAQVAKELGISRVAVVQAEAMGIFRFIAVLTELCGERLPHAYQGTANRAHGYTRRMA